MGRVEAWRGQHVSLHSSPPFWRNHVKPGRSSGLVAQSCGDANLAVQRAEGKRITHSQFVAARPESYRRKRRRRFRTSLSFDSLYYFAWYLCDAQNMNIPIAAANIKRVVMHTEAMLKSELGWLRMIFRSVATARTPRSRKGARSPLITAV